MEGNAWLFPFKPVSHQTPRLVGSRPTAACFPSWESRQSTYAGADSAGGECDVRPCTPRLLEGTGQAHPGLCGKSWRSARMARGRPLPMGPPKREWGGCPAEKDGTLTNGIIWKRQSCVTNFALYLWFPYPHLSKAPCTWAGFQGARKAPWS